MNLEDVVIDPVMRSVTGSVTREIGAAADRVADLIADISRMGEWSPECRRCEWLDGAAGPAEGARFRGWNRRGLARWSTTCTIVRYIPGRLIEWDTGYTRWSYRIEPLDGQRSLVTEEYQAHTRHLLSERTRWLQRTPDLDAHMTAAMHATLNRLAAVAESLA